MPDAPRQPPPKKEVALALLEESSMFIHLDPRRPDVLVPKGFMGQPQLVLQVGLNMAIPIPDLRVDEAGISCTLSFNRSAFWCRIPWTAVYALVGEDGRGGVWADDVPPEIQQQKPGAAPPKAPAKKPRPRLTVAGAAPAGGRPGGEASKGERKAPTRIAGARRLASVPSHDDGIVEDEPPPREAPAAPPAGEGPAGTPSQPPGSKKPKREIPPYLRRIK